MSIVHLGVDPASERGNMLKSIIEDLWDGDVCDIIQCERCSLVYANPFVSGTNEFYSIAYMYQASYYEWKWEYKITYEDIKSLSKVTDLAEINLLEVGAGNGVFIKMISPELIPKENILCTEFSYYGKEEILKYGINCVSKDISNLKNDKLPNKFDIICMFQVLEHMDHLKETFEGLNKMSNKGARLYIAVPNHKHREFYDAHSSYFDLPPTHISRWSVSSFKTAGEIYGWEILQHKYQPQNVFKRVRRFMFNRYYYFNKVSLWIDQISSPLFNKSLKLTTFAIFFIIYFYSIMKLIFDNLGVSQWICFVKKSNNYQNNGKKTEG